MRIGVVRETVAGERRVALVPDSIQRLRGKAFEVSVETGAGAGSWLTDEEYRAAGASIEPTGEALLASVDAVVRIHPPSAVDVDRMRTGASLVSLLYPQVNGELVRALAARQVTAIAVDSLPRTTLAQTMDALSSQGTVAGYRAVIRAAAVLPKFFPMLMTAAGTIRPARVLVLGAGVAGLQAIATARRLGAVVEAFDVRRVVKEQVESLGAKFVDAGPPEDAEGAGGYAREVSEASQGRIRAAIAGALARADVCVTTALVPGRPAPRLVTEEMVQGMRPGSVIVDLVAEQGGNCELTEPGRDLVRHGVTILGPVHLASDMAVDASQMYSRNMEKLLGHLTRDGALALNFQDPITRGCVVTHGGKILLGEGQ